MIEELSPRAVTLMTAAEPATERDFDKKNSSDSNLLLGLHRSLMSFCSSLVLVPKKSTPGFSQKHAKWFKAQVCAQLLAAMTDPANQRQDFQRKAGKTFAPSACAEQQHP